MKPMRLLFLTALALIGWHGACAAPALLPGDATILPAAGDQAVPALAAGAGGALVVWGDTRANPYGSYDYETSRDIYGVRLDSSGAVVDPVPISIYAGPGAQTTPRVSWNGSHWLVVFETTELSGTGSYYAAALAAVRVSTNGQVLDARAIPLPGLVPSGGAWQVASDGTNWVVVCQGTSTSGDVVAVRITPSGQVLDPPTRAILKASYYMRANFRFACVQGVFLLTFTDNDDTKGVRFDSALNLLDPGPISVLATPISGLAGGTDHFYLIWNRQNPDYSVVLAGSRLTPGGAKLEGTNGVNLSGTKTPYAYDPLAVAWDGTQWRVTWGDYTNLWTARVSAAGTVLDPGSVKVPGPRPGLTSGTGTGGLVLAWTGYTNGNNDVFTATLSASNGAGPNRCVSTGAPQQSRPDLAAGPNGYLVVYRSVTAAGARVLAQPLGPDGQALTSEPVQLDEGPGLNAPGSPNVAWSGSASLYLAAWGRSNGIVMLRLDAAGNRIDAAPRLTLAGAFGPADVAAVGDTFLVTSRKYGYTAQFIDAYGTRVRASDGVVLDTLRLGGGYVSSAPAVTALGGRFYAAFHSNWSHDDSGASTAGVLVPTTGTNLVSSGIYLFSTAGGNGIFETALASSGDTALLLQSAEVTSGVETDLIGFLIQTNGAASPMINLTPWAGNQYRPRAAWDGRHFVITYQDQRNRPGSLTLDTLDARGDLFGMRVSPGGAKIDPQGFLLSASPLAETDPTVAARDGASLFAWAGMRHDNALANLRIATSRIEGAANQWPVAAASATPRGGDVPLAVAFSSAGSTDPDGAVISYLWEFDDGTSSTAPNPAHTFYTPGDRKVKLTVTDNLGATTTQCLLVSATLSNQVPVAVARAVPQSGPPPLNVTLYADGSYDPDGQAGNIEWQSAEGGTYWGSTAYYTFTSAGSHTVTLRVHDSRGAVGTTNILINVGGPNLKPVALVSASPTSGPAPLWVNFSGAASYDMDGNIAAYAWTFGDGGTADYASPTHYYAGAGTYTAKLIVTDNAGGKGTNSVVIQVGASNRPPVAVVGATPRQGTVPLTVAFSSAGSGDPDGSIASYNWNFGDGGTSTAPNPVHVYTQRGYYLARLTVTDQKGATATASVPVSARRVPKLAHPRVAIPATFTFNLEGEPGMNYVIQSSADGHVWTDVLTLPGVELPAQITLPAAAGGSAVFWRAVMQ